jgi:hypothetical protein
MAKQTVNLGTAANDGTGDPLRTAFNKLNDNFDEVYGNNFVTNAMLNDDIVGQAELGAEFTTSSPLTAATDLDINFSTAAVFTTTSAIAMDLNFTSAEIGQVKTIIVTDSGGTSSLTFDTTSNTVVKLNGDYSATSGAVNYIQVQCIAVNSFILTISQVAV